jgi:hypothetical protein
VKPRPARTRRLYLTVGHRTTGRSLSTGRGATAAALARRFSRRRCLRPGYSRKNISMLVGRNSFKQFSSPHFNRSQSVDFNSVERYSWWGRKIFFRGRTWSKCTRTRFCQSLRKSIRILLANPVQSNALLSDCNIERVMSAVSGVTHGSSGSGCCA